jgi:hypothetical protein
MYLPASVVLRHLCQGTGVPCPANRLQIPGTDQPMYQYALRVMLVIDDNLLFRVILFIICTETKQ